MAHAAPPPPLFSLQLQAGHKAWQHLPRATTITVTEGAVLVHQRLLLAGTWVHLPMWVREGEQLRIAGGGWVELEAKTATQVHASVALAWWQGLRRVRLLRPRNNSSTMPQAV